MTATFATLPSPLVMDAAAAMENAWQASADLLNPSDSDLFFNPNEFENIDFGDLTHVEGGPAQDGQHQQPHFGDLAQHSHHQQQLATPTDMAGLNGDFLDFSIHTPYTAPPSQQHVAQVSFSLPEAMQFDPQRGMVPPTPNSAEMHANIEQYLAQRQQQLMNQQVYMRKDMGNFTPLVSPQMHSSHQSPNYPMFSQAQHQNLYGSATATPAQFLSPITSPVLDPQLQRPIQQFHFHSMQPTSQPSAPVDADVDMLIGEAAMPQEESRRPKRKAAVRGSAARVKQSPIVKAQSSRRKSNLSATIPPREANELIDALQGSRSATFRPIDSSNESGSINSSASPESLSDIVMGPPPKPASALQSPSILPSGHQRPTPITPANLLQLKTHPPRSSPVIQATNNSASAPGTPAQPFQQNNDESQPMLEDLTLPDPLDTAPARPELTRLDTAINGTSPTDTPTPRLPTNRNGPTSTTATAGPSPSLNGTSPKFVAGPTSKNLSSKTGGKGGRKRSQAGTGSQLVSPALRPKISPNIAPMLPNTTAPGTPVTPGPTSASININGNVSADYTTLLLASKSNYQNILDGTFAAVPGVTYPGQLTETLNSKRTSHKLAEQGRRNRINLALKELEGLIGSKPVEDTSGLGEKEKGNNSKAATVESAIDFIRGLQKQAMEREEEIERLKEKLKAVEGEGGVEKEEKVEAGKAAEEGDGGKEKENK